MLQLTGETLQKDLDKMESEKVCSSTFAQENVIKISVVNFKHQVYISL